MTETHWPCLEYLYLQHVRTHITAMSTLVSGVWMPNLSVLDISGELLGAPALGVLLQGDWKQLRRLQLTANLQDAAVFELITARCEHQQLRHLQTQAAQPFSNFVLQGWCSQGVFKRFAQWPGLEQFCIQHEAEVVGVGPSRDQAAQQSVGGPGGAGQLHPLAHQCHTHTAQGVGGRGGGSKG